MRAEPLFVLALALLVSAVPAPEAKADDGGLVSKRDGPALVKRDCKNNRCKCEPGTTPGVYCWACAQLIDSGDSTVLGDVTGWVYQCNEAGGCCAYGPRDSCANVAANPCGGA